MMAGEGQMLVEKSWLTASAHGTPGLSVTGMVSDSMGEECAMSGTVWLSEKAYKMARQQLKALGFDIDTEDLAELDRTPRLVGVKCPVTLANETYNGQTTLRIKFFGKNKGPAKPDAAAIAKAQAGLRAAKSKAQSDEPLDGDDIPF